jgi:hypothetical protein
MNRYGDGTAENGPEVSDSLLSHEASSVIHTTREERRILRPFITTGQRVNAIH